MNNLTKHCKRCDTTKSLDDFHRDSKSSDGKYSYCKECNKAKAKAAYHADPEGRREYERKRRERFPDRDREQNYKSKYGITLAQYNEMHAAQGGVCRACKKPESRIATRHLAVDHCHRTGKIRGLLCSNCNRALGLLDDDISRLRSLADYLEENAS